MNLFASVELGQMVRNSPHKVVKVYSSLADVDGDGWLDINKAIVRTFTAHPTLTPADIPDFGWAPEALMRINTNPLTTVPDVPGGSVQAGQAVPAGQRMGVERIAIRFEAREVVNKAANIFIAQPGSGVTLNNLTVNNNAAVHQVAMTEHLSSTACTPLSGSPHVAFSAHHPHLEDVSINVRSNDGAYNHNLDDAASKPASSDHKIPLLDNADSAAANHLHNPAVALPPGLHKCTYTVTLTVRRRLHTGEGALLANTPHTTFYYEP